jgi:hypothetical protein
MNYIMKQDFCTKTSRKLRDLGYAPKHAFRFARLFFTIQVCVYGLMGMYYLPSQVENLQIAGSGKGFSGARAGMVLPDFSGKR